MDKQFLPGLVLLLAAAFAGLAAAQPEHAADPPTRVGVVTAAEGSVVFAGPGETDWVELPRNRPLARGDRLWTDEGARAEVHFGAAVLHLDGRTFLEVLAVDDDVVQLAVNEGSVNARVRGLRAGDQFEISTPQLALRASQPGEWRIDADPQRGATRVVSRGGLAVLYGSGRGAQQVVPGRPLAFGGRDLAPAHVAWPAAEAFERWAAQRNHAEDQSVTARFVPRDVVGYPLLDAHGTWSLDPALGPIWFPRPAAAEWAPYREGRWEWISPWGWTWIDDAPWGFAPFHYGRWTLVGARWAWVPGPLGRHPAYAPALAGFVGGTPGIAWYPLAPGEIWYPYAAASPSYVRHVNRYLVADSRYYNTGAHLFLRRPDAVTVVRSDDFQRGRPVQGRRLRVGPSELARAQPIASPAPQGAGGEPPVRRAGSY